MSLVAEQAAFMRDVARLLAKAWELGFDVTGGELFRTPEQQQLHVQAGRSRTMRSNHLRRCAIDLNFFRNGQLVQTKAGLQELGDFWESLGPKNRWGGNWRSFVDVPHFERDV